MNEIQLKEREEGNERRRKMRQKASKRVKEKKRDVK